MLVFCVALNACPIHFFPASLSKCVYALSLIILMWMKLHNLPSYACAFVCWIVALRQNNINLSYSIYSYIADNTLEKLHISKFQLNLVSFRHTHKHTQGSCHHPRRIYCIRLTDNISLLLMKWLYLVRPCMYVCRISLRCTKRIRTATCWCQSSVSLFPELYASEVKTKWRRLTDRNCLPYRFIRLPARCYVQHAYLSRVSSLHMFLVLLAYIMFTFGMHLYVISLCPSVQMQFSCDACKCNCFRCTTALKNCGHLTATTTTTTRTTTAAHCFLNVFVSTALIYVNFQYIFNGRKTCKTPRCHLHRHGV